MDRLAYAGTTTILFATMNSAKLVRYSLNGQVNMDSLHTLAHLAAPAVLGVYVGKKTVGVVSERVFYRMTISALLIVGVNLVGRAILGRDLFVVVIKVAFA